MLTSQAVLDVIRWVMPDFRNNHDKVVFAVHAAFLTSGFDLTATGRPAFADYALSSSSQDLVGINGWNEFDKDYAFVYMNEKTSKKFLVKCLAMDDHLLIDALADGGVDVPHLEIEVGNYTTESSNVRELFKNLDKLVTDLNSEILYKLDATLEPVSSR
ncbi:putative proteasome inhibitor [Cardamine amara subsp. amara]|uniref:Proteasome inhibitor n=1 Tax=Cardamine amara subsp. amara TaxID=228776 RepID=A0ABD0ZML2_CARAN